MRAASTTPLRILCLALAITACSTGEEDFSLGDAGSSRPRDGSSTRDADPVGPLDTSAPSLDATPPEGGTPDAGTLDGAVTEGGQSPPGREVCGNGLDDDRNGSPDDNCPCTQGMSQRCFAGDPALAGVGACAWGTQLCEGTGEFGSWASCTGSGAPSAELCDRADNNCDGRIDEGCTCPPGTTRDCYSGPPITRGIGTCRAGMQTCMAAPDGSASWGPCTGEVVPDLERCDGMDRNCDGNRIAGCECDPETSRPCYEGPTGTSGRGICRPGTQACTQRPTGGTRFGPCMGQVLPLGEECGDGMDNDCDGAIDCMDSQCAGSPRCAPCTTGTVGELTTRPAEVLFVVDRSASMDGRSSDGSTKWVALRTAVNTVLPRLDASLFMGLVTFPTDGNCAVERAPEILLARPSASRISAWLARFGPSGNTPTFQALDTAERYYRGRAATMPRFIVLATDGAPNCGSNLSAVTARIASIRSSLGIDTFVLGIPGSDGSLRLALNAMADAGGRARAGSTRFYEAGSTAEFETALRAITASSAACTYRLPSRPPDPSRVIIQFDGSAVPRDASRRDGWDFTDATMTEVRFYGPACTRLGSGSVRVISARYNC